MYWFLIWSIRTVWFVDVNGPYDIAFGMYNNWLYYVVIDVIGVNGPYVDNVVMVDVFVFLYCVMFIMSFVDLIVMGILWVWW